MEPNLLFMSSKPTKKGSPKRSLTTTAGKAARKARRKAARQTIGQAIRKEGPGMAGKALDYAVRKIPVVGQLADTVGLAGINFENLFKKVQGLWGDMRAARDDQLEADDAGAGALRDRSAGSVVETEAPVAYNTVVKNFVDEKFEEFSDPVWGSGVRLTGTQAGIDIHNFGSGSVGAFGSAGLMVLPNPNAFVKYINAENFGGRVAQFSGLYARYQVLQLEAIYVPSVATSTANMFAIAVCTDPTIADPASFVDVSQYKGAMAAPFRAPARSTLIKNPEMEPRYCQLTTTTGADKQNTIQACLFGAASTAAGTSIETGFLIFAYDIALFDPVMDQGFAASPSFKPFYRAIAEALRKLPFTMDAKVRWEASFQTFPRQKGEEVDPKFLDWYLTLKCLPLKPAADMKSLPNVEDFQPLLPSSASSAVSPSSRNDLRTARDDWARL